MTSGLELSSAPCLYPTPPPILKTHPHALMLLSFHSRPTSYSVALAKALSILVVTTHLKVRDSQGQSFLVLSVAKYCNR